MSTREVSVDSIKRYEFFHEMTEKCPTMSGSHFGFKTFALYEAPGQKGVCVLCIVVIAGLTLRTLPTLPFLLQICDYKGGFLVCTVLRPSVCQSLTPKLKSVNAYRRYIACVCVFVCSCVCVCVFVCLGV